MGFYYYHWFSPWNIKTSKVGKILELNKVVKIWKTLEKVLLSKVKSLSLVFLFIYIFATVGFISVFLLCLQVN